MSGGFAAVVTALSQLATADTFGLVARFIGLIFVLSGGIKLRHPATAAQALVNLGLARDARIWAGRATGWFEFLFGMALALTALPILAAAAAAVLFVFVGLLTRQLVAGSTVPCLCFGEADGRLSRLSIARTAGLGALGTVAAIELPWVLWPVDRLATQLLGGLALLGAAALIRELPGVLRLGEHPAHVFERIG